MNESLNTFGHHFHRLLGIYFKAKILLTSFSILFILLPTLITITVFEGLISLYSYHVVQYLLKLELPSMPSR